jgi:hypothetical protein
MLIFLPHFIAWTSRFHQIWRLLTLEWMDLDPQVAPSTSTNVHGGSRQMSEKADAATDDYDPNIGNDFDDM